MPAGLSVILAGVVAASASGAYHDVNELGAGSKMYELAQYSLSSLKEFCATSSSMACSRISSATLQQVTRALREEVSGQNYVIEAETSAGSLHLNIHEQVWTNTLNLVEAVLTIPSVGKPIAFVSEPVIQEDIVSDGVSFAIVEHICPRGKQWMECGSPCEATCDDPAPMCAMSCTAKCACPEDKPVFQVHSTPIDTLWFSS